jgi:hypothetical protein
VVLPGQGHGCGPGGLFRHGIAGGPPFRCLCGGWDEVRLEVAGEFPSLVTKLSPCTIVRKRPVE